MVGGDWLMWAANGSLYQYPRNAFVSEIFLGLLLFEDVVDGGVEEGAIGCKVDALGIGLALDLVKPAAGVGLAADEFDVLGELGIAAGEGAGGDAVDVADGLKALDGADDFASADGSAR